MSRLRRTRRLLALAAVLVVTALVVPDASPRSSPAMLVSVDTATAVDHSDGVLWILGLGSDARLGEDPLRTRADAIQLVGLDEDSGAGVVIGVPRDSYVSIPGVGSDRVNAALTYGGPQLMARTVGDLVGVQPDYVFLTTFKGLETMVQSIGGVTVDSALAFTDDNMRGSIVAGRNNLNGFEALFFARARHFLPAGDFDRSANQQELLRGILRRVRDQQDRPGFLERGALSAMRNLSTDLPPVALWRLAQAATRIDPDRLRGCVLDGSYGTVNGASVVYPDTDQARRLGDEARDDATFDGPC